MATVIDSLVVLLGLDASNFKKGRETAEKETGETARKSKAAADDITKSLTEVGRTIAGLFLGFESVSGFTKFLGNLNSGEAALGRVAANIGMSGHELNKWGNAVKLAGGDAADAQAAFSQLTEDFQKMNATGEQSTLLQFLRARNVNIRDANGNLRNQGEIFEELADKTAQYGRQYQVTMFKQAGLSQGEINYLTQTKALRDDQLRLAERNNGVNEKSIADAQALQEYWRNIGSQIEAAGQKFLSTITPAIRDALAMVTRMFDEFKDTGSLKATADAFSAIASAIKLAYDGYKQLHDLFKDSSVYKGLKDPFNIGPALDILKKGIAFITPAAATASPALPAVDASPDTTGQYRNHNPGNLRPYKAGQATDSRGIRTFANDAEGKQALEDDLRAKMKEGLTTISQIISKYAPPSENDTRAYQADVSNRLRKGQNATLSESDIRQLAQAITAHEGAQIKTAKAAGGSTTTVQVDTINVHSASTDPKAVADQIPASIQRKFSVAQADTGQS